MKKLLSLITFVIISINLVFSVPAKPIVINVLQKNGTEISIRLQGDEHFNFKTTEDGVLIAENSNGIFEYAKMNQTGEISTTGVLAKNKEIRSNNETSFINTLYNNNVYEISTKIRKERAEQRHLLRSVNALSSTAAVGERGLVILVNFSDKAFVTPNANIAFCNLLNQKGYNKNSAVGSARDYFIACSDSIFQPTFDVYGPYTLPQTSAYYAANNDRNAEQMIIHACSLAYNAGVNLSQYDTSGNGYVDNVFVFYAGYSEASGGGSNTIWPHRWVVTSRPQFGNVRIYDYACSSELKNASGTEMDGIGTFVHEFSHVLGLPDLYNTYNSWDTNLEYWDVMDLGCYNGPGRNGDVPAMYSAYEMFYLGWFMPEILTMCNNYSLEPLHSANKKAYLVARNNSHNLNGQNPNATEFYMVENRQQISYDRYLPGSGLLITRINFNSSRWNNNTVNNSSPKGVAIMKAGSTMGSWAFPTSGVTSYNFESVTGSNRDWGKNVSQIQRSGQNITFNFQQTNCPTSPVPQISHSEFRENILRNKQSTEAIDCTGTTSITEIKDNKFEVINYPLNWSVSMSYGNYLMEIYAVNGILLKTFNFTNEINIAKSDFPNGVYLLKIISLNDNKIYFSKAIK